MSDWSCGSGNRACYIQNIWNKMNKTELECLKLQLKVLRSVEAEYSGRTIENIIDNIEQRIKHYQK